jgi:hypothetical protein
MQAFAPVFLHAGFGSAAAEEFHRFLTANRDALALAGYRLADPAPVPGAQAAPSRRARRLAAGRPDPQMVLSMPGLAGPVEGLLAGQFFAAAEARARSLRAALGRPVARIAVAVQPYDALFRMAWRRAAMTRAVEPFGKYATRMAEAPGGWCDAIEMLGEVMEADSVAVVAMPPSSRRMLEALMPDVALPFPAPHAAVPSVTETAVAALQRLLRQGVQIQPGQAERLLAFHARLPQSSEEPGYDGLALADLRGRYVADLAILSRRAGVSVAFETRPQLPARPMIAAE